jgi:hypothetical protein
MVLETVVTVRREPLEVLEETVATVATVGTCATLSEPQEVVETAATVVTVVTVEVQVTAASEPTVPLLITTGVTAETVARSSATARAVKVVLAVAER